MVVALPVQTGQREDVQTSKQDQERYQPDYEERLETLLEATYGKDSVDVLIYTKPVQEGMFQTAEETEEITGVLITVRAEVLQERTKADIVQAVCALFDLPSHKVAILVKY